MQFSNSLLALFMAASATQAFPIGFGLEVRKLSNPSCSATTTSAAAVTAATPAVAAAAPVSAAAASGDTFAATTYNAIQISSGTAGNGKANADKIFASIDTSNLAGVSAADLKFIQGVHDAAEDAEVNAFNPAIAKASGAAATALQNGKTCNKILKLTAEVLGLQIKGAQGANTAADVAAEQKKLANNIALDTKAAGQPQTAVPFTASIPA